MYQACIFDMDGTILNTLDSLAYYGNRALAAMGQPPIETHDYRQMVGNGVYKLIDRILRHAGLAETQENKKKLYDLYTGLYEADPLYLVTAYDGMEALLRRLRQEGCKLAVLSNKPHSAAVFIAEKYFPGIFDWVQGQQDGVPAKPDPTALLSILSRLGVTKEQTLYCGDSDVDMLTAQNAGVAGAGAAWGFRGREELVRSGAVFIAQSPVDLYPILRQTAEKPGGL